MVVEATAGYPWFVELVEPLADEVVLANPKWPSRKPRHFLRAQPRDPRHF